MLPTIFFSGPPSAPEGCEILNNTAENIEVACSPSFDGGVRQLFMAEVSKLMKSSIISHS